MGNRRMGARRLDALLRRGTTGRDTSYQAGASISPAVVSHRMYNEGVFIITEIVLDLGTSAADIRSSAVDKPIGTHSSTDGAQLMQWENDIHGKWISGEVFCAEALTTVTAVSLAAGDAVEPIGATISARQDIVAGVASNAVGGNGATAAGGMGTPLGDGHYVYLTPDDNGTNTYNAGQLVVRLMGVKAADVSTD
tara:strand:- start:6529 stop:7113 length:585 start_codon:yes stop_codon:yes gene_type:complete